jgi:hypothetical protein
MRELVGLGEGAPHALARRVENAGKHEFAVIGHICACSAGRHDFLLGRNR